MDRNAIYEKYIAFLEGLDGEDAPNLNHGTIKEAVESTGLGFFTCQLGITEIKPLENYRLWCHLKTGETKIFDFTPHLEKPIFQHLKDVKIFNDVSAPYGVPAWMDPDGKERDTEIGISYILIHGIDAS